MTEASGFRDNLGQLEGEYAVLGISPDPVERLKEFADAEQLIFSLHSEEGDDVARTWGCLGPQDDPSAGS